MNTYLARLGLGVLLISTTTVEVKAGAFVFAGEANGIDVIAHPAGYLGAGASLTLNVCIESASNNQAEMEIPIRNAISHWNQMVPSVSNLRLGADNNLVAGQVDWESTMMHELGHCIGLAHPNLASESGVGDPGANETKTTDGADNAFNVNAGPDAVHGSADDVRGDDINLHWYRRNSNNPFVLVPPVQASTYARDLAFLPAGHVFAANGDRGVSALLGFPGTEAILQQGQGSDEDQRTLTADDVGTLLLARTGVDGVAGNSDDYTVTLQYGGVNNTCDITAIIDTTFTGLAVCQLSGNTIASNHLRITSARMRFSATTNWHFAATRVPVPNVDTATVATGGTVTQVNGAQASLLANDTHPTGATLTMSTTAFPGPANGNVTLNANGTFSYTHNGNAATSDTFTYRACVSGDNNACSHQRVNITITAGNDSIFSNGFE